MRVEIRVDTDINHNHFSSYASCKGVDGRPICKKVSDHLLGYGLGVGAYAFLGHTVICGKDVDRSVGAVRRFLFSNRDNLGGNVLEPPQTAWRFGQAIQLRLRERFPVARGMNSTLSRKRCPKSSFGKLG